ncbi:hypothetical protein HMPREF9554_02652 [Treponema phagedenis F0421]|nr:hypothetical protein HMPREF9554_02652 [Treponema phagedenis F0421]
MAVVPNRSDVLKQDKLQSFAFTLRTHLETKVACFLLCKLFSLISHTIRYKNFHACPVQATVSRLTDI